MLFNVPGAHTHTHDSTQRKHARDDKDDDLYIFMDCINSKTTFISVCRLSFAIAAGCAAVVTIVLLRDLCVLYLFAANAQKKKRRQTLTGTNRMQFDSEMLLSYVRLSWALSTTSAFKKIPVFAMEMQRKYT